MKGAEVSEEDSNPALGNSNTTSFNEDDWTTASDNTASTIGTSTRFILPTEDGISNSENPFYNYFCGLDRFFINTSCTAITDVKDLLPNFYNPSTDTNARDRTVFDCKPSSFNGNPL